MSFSPPPSDPDHPVKRLQLSQTGGTVEITPKDVAASWFTVWTPVFLRTITSVGGNLLERDVGWIIEDYYGGTGLN